METATLQAGDKTSAPKKLTAPRDSISAAGTLTFNLRPSAPDQR